MVYKYDVRLTFRDFHNKSHILKQFYISDLVFANPISAGESIVLPHFGYRGPNPVFWCNVKDINHSPAGAEPSKSYLEAEYKSGAADFDKIEDFLMKNYSCEDIL